VQHPSASAKAWRLAHVAPPPKVICDWLVIFCFADLFIGAFVCHAGVVVALVFGLFACFAH
jgi:hypothetical protein